MKRVAILDLGTNTFNLLIAEINISGSYHVLIDRRLPVKLGENRINDGEIIPAAYKRGIEAIKKHFKVIDEYQVTQIRAFGTSAFRTAGNGYRFLEDIKALKKLDIEIISGDREAYLIYLGVRQSLTFQDERFVILDIGGGSNEFIVADMKRILWKKSYPLGVARLLERFNPSDPITTNEISKIKHYLWVETADLFKVLRDNNIKILVGASGAFETFVTMLNNIEVTDTECAIKKLSTEINFHAFNELFERIIHSTYADRLKMKGLEPMRVEMIVLASLFVNFILENHTFEKLIQSNFALKEGAVYELLNQNY